MRERTLQLDPPSQVDSPDLPAGTEPVHEPPRAPRGDLVGDPPLRGSPLSGLWLKGLAPLVLVAILVAIVLRMGPAGIFQTAFPPIEELTIERVVIPGPGELRVSVVNGGPEPVTVAQVIVDDAIWTHDVLGPRTIERLQRRVIRIPYPWVEGEPHNITLVSSTGLTFGHDIAVATQSPTVGPRYLWTFALLGIYVGVIPVFLGLLWLPFLRGIARRWLDFFLSLTMGLLLFLGVDALVESTETAALVPSAFQGGALVLMGVLGTPLLLAAIGRWRTSGTTAPTPLYVASLIALGIGLHNFGEGLVIGTAYSTGEIALGTFLVIGFLLHNTTEGLGIVAPLAATAPRLRHLVLLGAVAGVPTIAGTWIGGFSYSPVLTTLFFAIGAGAIAQVLWELWKLFARRPEGGLTRPLNAAGLIAGMAIMYVTGLYIAA
ncbi:MAG TPA: ZIP family metal transporter [Gemmatimonadaceae bacterium]|nr:ZIP family metal transporter [Gemmatimonadaceae bacterium]